MRLRLITFQICCNPVLKVPIVWAQDSSGPEPEDDGSGDGDGREEGVGTAIVGRVRPPASPGACPTYFGRGGAACRLRHRAGSAPCGSVAPADQAMLDRFVRSLLTRGVAPAQAVADHKI